MSKRKFLYIHMCEIDYFSYFILLKRVEIIMSKIKNKLCVN